jgi:hypothetical protein
MKEIGYLLAEKKISSIPGMQSTIPEINKILLVAMAPEAELVRKGATKQQIIAIRPITIPRIYLIIDD